MEAATGAPATELIPDRLSLPQLRKAAAGCKACPLWRSGTQTVFGAGTRTAEVMLIGEQPGDREDHAGKPFVGPAGRELDKGLEEAGIDPKITYTTNVVKHFKWEARGKRRIHQKPNAKEVAACRPWLDSELAAVKPRAVVLLGATAAQALLGSSFKVTKERGRVFESDYAELTMATLHPSSILRSRTDEERLEAREAFTEDLKSLSAAL